jgi:hypothetical protein
MIPGATFITTSAAEKISHSVKKIIDRRYFYKVFCSPLSEASFPFLGSW